MVVSKLKRDNTTTMCSTTSIIQGCFTLTPQLLDVSCVSFVFEASGKESQFFDIGIDTNKNQ